MDRTIYISRTYATISPDSAEFGDYEEQGFIEEREEVTFHELVEMLKNGRPSCYPPSGETNEWVTYSESTDHFTCIERFEMVHFHREQSSPHAAMLWRRAFKQAGLIK
jgi:hypothetical protein